MAGKGASAESFDLSLSRDELVALNNSLAYVCHAIALPEFSTVIGVERADALKLLRRLGARLSDPTAR